MLGRESVCGRHTGASGRTVTRDEVCVGVNTSGRIATRLRTTKFRLFRLLARPEPTVQQTRTLTESCRRDPGTRAGPTRRWRLVAVVVARGACRQPSRASRERMPTWMFSPPAAEPSAAWPFPHSPCGAQRVRPSVAGRRWPSFHRAVLGHVVVGRCERPRGLPATRRPTSRDPLPTWMCMTSAEMIFMHGRRRLITSRKASKTTASLVISSHWSPALVPAPDNGGVLLAAADSRPPR